MMCYELCQSAFSWPTTVSVGSAGWLKRKLLGRPTQSILSHASTGMQPGLGH
jgi:hypothetical protein